MINLCWLLWSVCAGCYGQSLLVVMVSLCWLLWSVSAGCYGQSLLLWSVSVRDLVVRVSLCWRRSLLWSVAVGGQADYFLACCIGCLAAWLPCRLLFFLGRGGRSSVSMDHRALPHIISQDHRVSVTVKSLLTTQHRNQV